MQADDVNFFASGSNNMHHITWLTSIINLLKSYFASIKAKILIYPYFITLQILSKYSLIHMFWILLYNLIYLITTYIFVAYSRNHIILNTYLNRFSAPDRSISSLLISMFNFDLFDCNFPRHVAARGSEP